MAPRLVAVTYDADDPARSAAFWSGLLGRPVVPETDGALLRGDAVQVGLRFVMATDDRPRSERSLHLHLTSTSPEDMYRTVRSALDLGARHIDVGQLPEEGHVVLADPEGNPFCVIPPDSQFLADCGRLGEVACDGTADAGRFWSEALGWPLVWDQDGETAIQSPAGGTKIAWGGPPVVTKAGRNRQRFDLAAPDLEASASALVALGATRLGGGDSGVDLADPDGNEFRVAAG